MPKKPAITMYPSAAFKAQFQREVAKRKRKDPNFSEAKFALYLVGLGWEAERQRLARGGVALADAQPAGRVARKSSVVDVRPTRRKK